MDFEAITDDQILYIVGECDKELFATGVNIRERYWKAPELAMKKLGINSYIMAGNGKPKILDRIEEAYRSICRPQDIAIGGHMGVYMYHDIFVRIFVPIGYGTVDINPLLHTDLTDNQRRIIQTEPDQIHDLLDQFCDVADIQYGTVEINNPYNLYELTVRFLNNSRLHLHAAAAILTGGYDYRGAVQSALLANELALKAAVAAQGLGEKDIKDKFSHKLRNLAEFIGKAWPKFDLDRVVRAIEKHPDYVLNRYSPNQPSRTEVGHIAMKAQYVVSEVVRQMSDRNFRECITPPLERHYPE